MYTLRKIVSILLLYFHLTAKVVSGQKDFLNIACGSPSDGTDERGLHWVSDKSFINVGKVGTTQNSSSRSFYLRNFRTFPNPLKRSCYILPLSSQQVYLLRLWFDPPSHVVAKGPFTYFIMTEEMLVNKTYSSKKYEEWILTTTGTTINLCLLKVQSENTVSNEDVMDPFISAIQLIKLQSGMYSQVHYNTMLRLLRRTDIGGTTQETRYPEDEFDRIWSSSNLQSNKTLTTHRNIDIADAENRPPIIVMQTAIPAQGFDLAPYDSDTTNSLLLLFYFAGLRNVSISFKVIVNDLSVPLNLNTPYKDAPASFEPRFVNDVYKVSFVSTSGQPIINALEAYGKIRTDQKTVQEDLVALKTINKAFKSKFKTWVADPCYVVPWEHIKCIDTTVSELDISGQGLAGTIPKKINSLSSLVYLNLSNNALFGQLPDLSNLKSLETLDVRNNKLNGSIPKWLTELKLLKELGMQNNNFSGQIPQDLLGRFSKSFSGNNHLESSKPQHKKTFLILGVTIIAFILMVVIAVAFIRPILKRKRSVSAPPATGSPPDEDPVFVPNSTKLRPFTMNEIVSATNEFSEVIGRGGFGSVFYGKLPDGVEMAIKVLSSFSNQGKNEFLNELHLLSQVNHNNLVKVLGYCNHSRELMIVYEYMSSGSLRDHLHGINSSQLEHSWKARLKIALDAALGLEYMHVYCNPKIIHRDLKSANILLDSNLNGKLSDLGLSRGILDDATHITTTIKGTLGYLDPEYFNKQTLTEKSDIYSMGVVLLEIICGRPPIDTNLPDPEINLLQWVRKQPNYETLKVNVVQYLETSFCQHCSKMRNGASYHALECNSRDINQVGKWLGQVRRFVKKKDFSNLDTIVDRRLPGRIYSMKSVYMVIQLAMKCVKIDPSFRPNASQIVLALKEAFDEEDGVTNQSMEEIVLNSDLHSTSDSDCSFSSERNLFDHKIVEEISFGNLQMDI